MMERRAFLASLGAATVASQVPLKAAEGPASGRITLLHTNDTHSRIEPFGPGNGAISGKGGMARRATLVNQLRQQLGPVLLLDAGDTFQGTPYFNRYKGRLDYQLMRMVGYDAATLGNHDFDNGVEMLVEAMASMEQLKHRNPPFAFLNCNFDCKGAPALAKRVRPYLVREFPGVRVGITGVGVAFAGLVAPKNHEGITWRDPYESLKPVVKRLREVEKVDLVVVLSHLGYDNKDCGPRRSAHARPGGGHRRHHRRPQPHLPGRAGEGPAGPGRNAGLPGGLRRREPGPHGFRPGPGCGEGRLWSCHAGGGIARGA